jgi:hypothetical protein
MKIFKIANLFMPINWDSEKGYGETPNARNIEYLGFTKNMNVSDFLNLVPKGFSNKETIPFIENALEKGEPICPPFLMTHWDEENKRWLVIDHEGRSRSQAVLNKYGNGIQIPVHIFPRYMRNRDITDEMRNASFVSQDDAKNLW